MKFRWMSVLLLVMSGWSASAQNTSFDWPQWRGPNRDGISLEKGIVSAWPAAGLKPVWTAPIGEAYSAIAVSQGRLFTMDSKGQDEYIVSLDAATGKEIWRVKTGSAFSNDQGNGPRSTPTVDGNWVYALSPTGHLLALNAKDGKQIWAHDLVAEYGSEIPRWGTSTSPLIEKDLLLVDVGGKTGYSIMAFNKRDGSVVWKTHTDKQGYSSPIAVTVNGVRQFLFFTGTSLVSVSPQGQVLWKYPWRTDWDANIATPIFIAPDKVYISTSYGTGAAVLKIIATKDKSTFEEVWRSKVSKNHFNSSVLYQGHIYGFDDAILQCIEASTGTEKWKKSGFGKGSVLLVEGHLIVLGERGQLALVEAAPAAYKEKAQMQAVQGKTWTVPTLANGKLYIRNQKEIVCFNLKG